MLVLLISIFQRQHVICASSDGIACSGDSGGPLICQRCSSCSWYVAGIFKGGGCKVGAIVFLDVSKYSNFIKEHTASRKVDTKCPTATRKETDYKYRKTIIADVFYYVQMTKNFKDLNLIFITKS